MANVTVTCSNFAAAYAAVNGTRTLNVSRRAVLRSVVTVGAQRFGDVFSLGWRGCLHRVGMGLSAFSFLKRSPAGLCLSDCYGNLDGSERAAVTYWYGMALAKIVADVELGVPWLAHVDRLIRSGVLRIDPSSNERGDLVGRGSNGDWHVVEAKGRSSQVESGLLEKAKWQASRVISISGQPPATTSACITSLFTQPISVLLDDPPLNDGNNGEHWRIGENGFFRQYYHGIIKYLREFGHHRKQTIGNAAFVTAPLYPFFWGLLHMRPPRPLSKYRLDLGLLASIKEAPERAPSAVRDLPRDDEGRAGSDGIAIFGSMPDWGFV